MKKIILLASTILIVALVFTACNKTKMYENRLDGGEWNVTELSVDGVNETELPHWNIGDCDAYKESCTGEWKNHEESNQGKSDDDDDDDDDDMGFDNKDPDLIVSKRGNSLKIQNI